MIRRFIFLLLDPVSGLDPPKRGSPATWLQTCFLFLLDPFFCRQQPKILQKGFPCNLTSDLLPFPAAGPLLVPWLQTRFLFLLLDPFCPVSGPGPPQPDCRLASFSCCWTPFCPVSGLDPPKMGWPLVLSSRLFESLAAQRGCAWVTPLCSFFCSWPWLSVWHLLYWYPASVSRLMQGPASSVGRVQGT